MLKFHRPPPPRRRSVIARGPGSRDREGHGSDEVREAGCKGTVRDESYCQRYSHSGSLFAEFNNKVNVVLKEGKCKAYKYKKTTMLTDIS